MPDTNNTPIGENYDSVQNPYDKQYIKRPIADYFLKFLTAGTISTPWEKAEAQRLQNKANWDSAHAEQIRQEAYNSPAAQAERMRQAGLNPLLNGDMNPGESASGVLPETPFGSSMEEYNKAQDNINNIVVSAVQMALGITSGVAQMQDVAASKDLKQLQSFMGTLGLTEDVITKLAGSKFEEFDLGNIGTVDYDDANLSRALEEGLGFDFMAGLPKKSRKAFSQMFARMYNSPYGKKLRADAVSAAADSLVEASGKQPIYKGFSFDTTNKGIEALTFANSRIALIQQDCAQYYYTEYYKLQKDVSAGRLSAEQAEIKANELLNQSRMKMFGAMNDLFNQIFEKYKDGSWFEKLINGGLLTGMAMYSQGFLPKLNFSSNSFSDFYSKPSYIGGINTNSKAGKSFHLGIF